MICIERDDGRVDCYRLEDLPEDDKAAYLASPASKAPGPQPARQAPDDGRLVLWLGCPKLSRPEGCGCYRCDGGPLDGRKVGLRDCVLIGCPEIDYHK